MNVMPWRCERCSGTINARPSTCRVCKRIICGRCTAGGLIPLLPRLMPTCKDCAKKGLTPPA